MKIKKNLKAFTLAEVLIALTVIGVIAAITVPALIQRTQKQEYVSALQKAYSTLSQAANMIIAEHGSPKCSDGGWACSTEEVYSMFKKYLNNAKDCGAKTGCLAKTKVESGYENWDTVQNWRRLILADGAVILFFGANGACSGEIYGTKDICGYFVVDVNGEKKPNTYGQDVFWLYLKEKGFYPGGCDDETGYYCSNSSRRGCACRVLSLGRMDY